MAPHNESVLYDEPLPLQGKEQDPGIPKQNGHRPWEVLCQRMAYDMFLPHKDQTFNKIEANFIEKSIPSNHTSKAHHALAHMTMEGEPFKGDFHKFKSKFELKAT